MAPGMSYGQAQGLAVADDASSRKPAAVSCIHLAGTGGQAGRRRSWRLSRSRSGSRSSSGSGSGSRSCGWHSCRTFAIMCSRSRRSTFPYPLATTLCRVCPCCSLLLALCLALSFSLPLCLSLSISFSLPLCAAVALVIGLICISHFVGV